VTADEVVELQDELASLLHRVGPVQFMRDLCQHVGGGQVLAQETRALDERRRSLLFLYRDPAGKEVFLSVLIDNDPAGPSRYSLQVVRSDDTRSR
jgi:hypothetical protein